MIINNKHASVYWTISQCWFNPGLSGSLMFGTVVGLLREIIHAPKVGGVMKTRAQTLLDDIVSNSAQMGAGAGTRGK